MLAHDAKVSDSSRSSYLPRRLRILTPKQMLQRLTLALALVKTGNKSRNLLIEIRQIIVKISSKRNY